MSEKRVSGNEFWLGQRARQRRKYSITQVSKGSFSRRGLPLHPHSGHRAQLSQNTNFIEPTEEPIGDGRRPDAVDTVGLLAIKEVAGNGQVRSDRTLPRQLLGDSLLGRCCGGRLGHASTLA